MTEEQRQTMTASIHKQMQIYLCQQVQNSKLHSSYTGGSGSGAAPSPAAYVNASARYASFHECEPCTEHVRKCEHELLVKAKTKAEYVDSATLFRRVTMEFNLHPEWLQRKPTTSTVLSSVATASGVSSTTTTASTAALATAARTVAVAAASAAASAAAGAAASAAASAAAGSSTSAVAATTTVTAAAAAAKDADTATSSASVTVPSTAATSGSSSSSTADAAAVAPTSASAPSAAPDATTTPVAVPAVSEPPVATPPAAPAQSAAVVAVDPYWRHNSLTMSMRNEVLVRVMNMLRNVMHGMNIQSENELVELAQLYELGLATAAASLQEYRTLDNLHTRLAAMVSDFDMYKKQHQQQYYQHPQHPQHPQQQRKL